MPYPSSSHRVFYGWLRRCWRWNVTAYLHVARLPDGLIHRRRRKPPQCHVATSATRLHVRASVRAVASQLQVRWIIARRLACPPVWVSVCSEWWVACRRGSPNRSVDRIVGSALPPGAASCSVRPIGRTVGRSSSPVCRNVLSDEFRGPSIPRDPSVILLGERSSLKERSNVSKPKEKKAESKSSLASQTTKYVDSQLFDSKRKENNTNNETWRR